MLSAALLSHQLQCQISSAKAILKSFSRPLRSLNKFQRLQKRQKLNILMGLPVVLAAQEAIMTSVTETVRIVTRSPANRSAARQTHTALMAAL